MNGTRLENRVVQSVGKFEMAWTVPPEHQSASLVEVRLDCRPTFRPSWVPFKGDRRRLAFQLDEIAFLD